MSARKRGNPPRRGGRGFGMVLVAGLGLAGGWGCDSQAPPREAAAGAGMTNPPSGGTASAPAADRAAVKGRWQRADGDYVLDIRGVDAAAGKLEAHYFNPQPIHVSRAEVAAEGGKVKVLVELNDVNYPGCTYRLTYFPGTDQLYGVYFQAALGESYDVEFSRLR